MRLLTVLEIAALPPSTALSRYWLHGRNSAIGPSTWCAGCALANFSSKHDHIGYFFPGPNDGSRLTCFMCRQRVERRRDPTCEK